MARYKDLKQLKEAYRNSILEDCVEMINLGKFEAAINKYEAAPESIRMNDKYCGLFSDAYYQIGKIKQFTNAPKLCLGYYKKALELQKDLWFVQQRCKLIREHYEEHSAKKVTVNGEILPVTSDTIKMMKLKSFRWELNILCGVNCDKEQQHSPLICAECKEMVKQPITKLENINYTTGFFTVGIYRYQGDIRSNEKFTRLIREFKMGSKELANPFAQLMADYLKRRTNILKFIDLIATVPVDPQRQRDRGYNPPGIIASELSKNLCIPYFDNLLKKDGSPHARDLNAYEVMSNFSIDIKFDLSGRNVLLIDDIATRGYTLSACSKRLKEMGAGNIYGAVLAQSETTHRRKVKMDSQLDKLTLWYQVSQISYLGPVRFKSLLEYFATNIGKIFELSEDELLSLPFVNKQILPGIQEQKTKNDEAHQFMEKQLALQENCKGGIVLLDDPNYPEILKKSSMCHPILYYRGQIERISNYRNILSIVGSRKANDDSLRIAYTTSNELAKNHWAIASGLAQGIDSKAHMGALDADGFTIAVVGCGPDIIYPSDSLKLNAAITEKGVIISEFPFGSVVEDWKLKKRNKTIVGFSLAAFVVQSSIDGGAMNAAKACKEQKKKIFTLLPKDNNQQFSGNIKIIREMDGIVVTNEKTPYEIEKFLE